MIFKTRKNRKVFIEALDLNALSESERLILCQKLYDFSLRNTSEITSEYLLKRLTNYNILCLATSNNDVVGFGFADYRKITAGFPLIHFGLMIIDLDWRGDRLSRLISRSTVKYVTKKNGFKTYLIGFAISAKCSSPVSFYRLQQASLKLGFPKFTKDGDLNFVSKTKMGKQLSHSIARTLGLGDVDNFLLLDSNVNSGFMLAKEDYITNNFYEEKVVSFFKKNVIPNHEVLFVSYGHPVFIL